MPAENREYMKNTKTDKKIFSFHSISSPGDFMARLKDEAANADLKMEQTESGFDLQIDSNHGGRIVYQASISADEKGGSLISGEIITIPWTANTDKKKNLFRKILLIIGCMIVLPFVLIFLLCYGICALFVRLFCGKNIVPDQQEKLCGFMLNKMCCKRLDD